MILVNAGHNVQCTCAGTSVSRIFLSLLRKPEWIFYNPSLDYYLSAQRPPGAFLSAYNESKCLSIGFRVLNAPAGKSKFTFGPVIQLWGTYTENKLLQINNTCTRLSTATLFVTAEDWRQPKCLSIESWLCNWNTNTTEYHAVLWKHKQWLSLCSDV